ncbi:hypothetical protein [Campylobacter helveticus]|uniref:HTH cro/C1-type domain-containing protein n=1 Tax=Campylobacter helveticus TaxID=28898 RepID=A0AAX2UI13_9BACT|nr:hypothetical protein [Campylobacter helveticus]MCR2040425.1 hypothetical protein [Campylobacter helveticus]MCR2063235.1 hypothetical protein [Campylobacter helveticus]QBL10996.1 hypothetical protein A0073_00135 [Campylobacter helveticus]TNB55659.1 hypothetical protein FDW47_03500 [Campylobacter helveticus]TNB55977.1 hypothetical protein FDW44_08805 [Campylobacter helveticus]
MIKEEFKQLRAEAGYRTDSDFARDLRINVSFLGSCSSGYSPYPHYFKSFLLLKKLANDFSLEKYESFFSSLKRQGLSRTSKLKTKSLGRQEKLLIENAKISLQKDSLSLKELEELNFKLHKELEVLEKLALEVKNKK